jgi:hypothetical protein
MNYPDSYTVVTVPTILDRDKLIKQVYEQLIGLNSIKEYTVVKDQVNRIRVYKNGLKGVRALIRTYLVIVLPVLIDLSPLYDLEGVIDFKLDHTIQQLNSIIEKLKNLQGCKIRKGKSNESTLGQLVECLREIR